MFVRLHRTVKSEEVLVQIEGIREDLVSGRIALTANLLRLRRGVRDKYRDFAIRTRADFLSTLCALRAEFCRFALPFGLHALINGLAILFREVGAPDTHVHHLNALSGRLAVNEFANARHKVRTLIANHMRECYFAQHTA